MKFSLVVIFVLATFCGLAQVNQVDAQGRKQGPWQKAYEGARVLEYTGQFKNDKPVGKFTYFYKSSKVKAVVIHEENSNRSKAYFYHENGSLMSHGIYKDQKKDSVWVNFGPSERLSNTETYVNGELHGKKVVYYVPEIVTDKSQIPAAIYHYKNGKLDGEFKEYFDPRNVKTSGQYQNNKKVGIWIQYHPNGNKMTFVRYKDGVKHGWSFAYDESGKEIGKKYFYYGRHLEGKQLKEKMEQMKALGINPNE